MKIDIYSDTHLDTWARWDGRATNPAELLKELRVGDSAIFAGDAGNGSHWYNVMMDGLREAYDGSVVGEYGNHDYYKSGTGENVDPRTRSVKVHSLGGKSVVSCTLWTNFRGTSDILIPALASRSINDWVRIPQFRDHRDSKSWLTPIHLYRAQRSMLLRLAETNNIDIVVTHFPPLILSEHESYEGDRLNPYFVNDDPELVEAVNADLWVHGHTHNSFDYIHGNTRVVCNPGGYPGENTHDFKEAMRPMTVEL